MQSFCLCLSLIALTASAAPKSKRSLFAHTAQSEASAGKPFPIEGVLKGKAIQSVVARVRGPGEPFVDYPLERQYGDLYRVTLPSTRMAFPGIEYYLEGINASGDRVPVHASAEQPVRVIIVRDTEPPVAQDSPPEAPPESAPSIGPVDAGLPPAAIRVDAGAHLEVESASPAALQDELAVYSAEVVVEAVSPLERSEPLSSLMPTVLTAQELRQRGVRYVFEALDLVPGLSTSRDVQGFYRVAIRGLRSDAETLITLNGQRLNNFYDAKALANLPIDNLERIEIYRGPAAVDVGLGNMVGAINLVTRREAGLQASATAGLYEAFDGHLNGAHAWGPVMLFGDVDVASQRGGKRPVERDALDLATPRPKSTSDQRLLVNAGLGASVITQGFGEFDASARLIWENRSALVGLLDVVGPDSRLEWLTVQAQAGWKRVLADKTVLSVRGWFDHQATRRLWQLAPDGWLVGATAFPEGILEQATFGARGLGATAKGEFSLPFRNRLTAGLSVEHQSLTQADVTTNVNSSDGAMARPADLRLPTEDGLGGRAPVADRLGLGVFVSDVWTPIAEISINAGLRFDLTQLPKTDELGQWAGSAFVPSLGPRVGVAVSPVRPLTLRAQYGRAFRAPSPQELAEAVPDSAWSQGRLVGNSGLQGAAIDSVEVGGEYAQSLSGGTLTITGRAFFARLSNAIAQIDTTGDLVSPSNRPLGVQALGAEGEVRFESAARLSVWLNASWVRAEDLGTPQQSRLLTDVAQIRMNGGLTVPLGPWLNLDVVGRFASERRNTSRSVLELVRRYTLPGNTTVTAQLRTERLFDHLEFTVLGQNVFNFEYFDDVSRPDRISSGVPRETWQVFAMAKVGF